MVLDTSEYDTLKDTFVVFKVSLIQRFLVYDVVCLSPRERREGIWILAGWLSLHYHQGDSCRLPSFSATHSLTKNDTQILLCVNCAHAEKMAAPRVAVLCRSWRRMLSSFNSRAVRSSTRRESERDQRAS